MEIVYRTAVTEDELSQIIRLQGKNLRHTRSAEEESDQGFVTVQHDLGLLQEMNDAEKHVVAMDGHTVAGYALAMVRAFKERIPILAPMFDLLENITVEGERVGDSDFIVMGQVCVAQEYRGKGIFQGLYRHYFELYKPKYGWVITEVAARNTRSLRAHLNVGFKEIYRYDEPGMEEWVVVRY